MLTITWKKEEVEKIKEMLEDNDCRGVCCTKNEMRKCTQKYNKCPCCVENINFIYEEK